MGGLNVGGAFSDFWTRSHLRTLDYFSVPRQSRRSCVTAGAPSHPPQPHVLQSSWLPVRQPQHWLIPALRETPPSAQNCMCGVRGWGGLNLVRSCRGTALTVPAPPPRLVRILRLIYHCHIHTDPARASDRRTLPWKPGWLCTLPGPLGTPS